MRVGFVSPFQGLRCFGLLSRRFRAGLCLCRPSRDSGVAEAGVLARFELFCVGAVAHRRGILREIVSVRGRRPGRGHVALQSVREGFCGQHGVALLRTRIGGILLRPIQGFAVRERGLQVRGEQTGDRDG
jgi:hypothetical protein